MTIDAHAHVWQRRRTPQPWIDSSMGAIDRDIWMDELRATQSSSGIDRSVLVQTSNTVAETVDLLAAADGTAGVLGVVGWIDLESDVPAQLRALALEPGGGLLVGIRHLCHLDPDPDWLLRPSVHAGLESLADSGLPFDVVVRPVQLRTVAAAIAAHPRLTFVLDHLGKPPIASGSLEAWRADIAAIAALPNSVAKLSGLALEADRQSWSVDDVRPVVAAAIEAFGAGRVMFGSDWPLVELTGGLPRWLAVARELVAEHDHPAVFAQTAASVYRLGGRDA